VVSATHPNFLSTLPLKCGAKIAFIPYASKLL